MKDSGVEWVGMIPDEWQVCPIKYVATLYTGNSIKDEDKDFYMDSDDARPYVATKDIDAVLGTVNYDNGQYIKRNDTSFKVAPANSVLMCIEGGSAGRKKTLLNQEVSFVNKLCCFCGSNKMNGSYLYRFLSSPNYEEEFACHVSGMIGGVSVSELKSIPVIVPPIKEQQRIADYLNVRCSSIDNVIAKTQASIDEYKTLKRIKVIEAVTNGVRGKRPLKDTGIDWIGPIPKDWNVCRIKNVIYPREKAVLDSDDVITCFRDGQVALRKNRREEGFTISFTEHGYHGIDVGDLAIHGMDAFAGAIGCSEDRGKISPVVHVCETSGNNRFYMYYLRSIAYRNILMDFSNGIRIRSSDYRNFSRLGVFPAIMPSLDEQREIADYLDSKCAAIDTLISKKQQFIDELTAYKKSLIYEYVTGKKEVPA